MSTNPIAAAPPGYEAAMATFGQLLDLLTGDALAGADHAAVKRLLRREGTEVMRLLYESWLCSRAEAEPEREVEGSDHVVRTHHRHAARTMESLFGTVTLTRDRVGARGGGTGAGGRHRPRRILPGYRR